MFDKICSASQAAATRLNTLTGEKLTAKDFEVLDIKLLEIITDAVNKN